MWFNGMYKVGSMFQKGNVAKILGQFKMENAAKIMW